MRRCNKNPQRVRASIALRDDRNGGPTLLYVLSGWGRGGPVTGFVGFERDRLVVEFDVDSPFDNVVDPFLAVVFVIVLHAAGSGI